jgi:LPXTG-motif cell wall-anchored protein
MKSISNVLASVSCAALLVAGFVPQARADAWNKKTIMTINEPLQVPKMVLQPGKYVLKLVDSQSDRHIVQIFDEKEKHLFTTILAIPNYRLRVRGKTEFQFWETPAGQPHALRAWFYPGDNFGHEFAYDLKMSTQIAGYSKEKVATTYANSDEELTTAKVEAPNNDTAETTTAVVETPKTETETTVIAQTTQPAPEPAPVVVEQAPAPAPLAQVEQADRPEVQTSLPQTASNYPLIALIGLLSLGAFTVLSVRAKGIL